MTYAYDDRWTEEPQLIQHSSLTISDDLRPRLQKFDKATLNEYIERMREDADRFPHAERFPPIHVIRTEAGLNLLVDGWHRVEAAHHIGISKLFARVRPGEWSDAVEAAAAQNTRHGKPRTDEDKHRAVEMLLALPEWRETSDRAVAKHCAVGHHLVAKVRASLESGREPSIDNRLKTLELPQDEPPRFQEPNLRRGLDGVVRDVSRQGAAAERTRQREWEPEPGGGRPPDRDRPPPPMSPDDYGTPAPMRAPSGPVTRLPRSIELLDMEGWLADKPDSERLRLGALVFKAMDSDSYRRRLIDVGFGSITSTAERLEVVRKWLEQHERRERA